MEHEDEILDDKRKEVYCEFCKCNIKKLGWTKHVGTTKHKDNVNGVEKVEKKKCRKCRCWRVFELYRGENLTCNICLGHRENWAKKNPEKVKEMNKNYWDERKEEKKEYNKEYSSVDVECKICECWVKKSNWARHEKTSKHILGVNGGKVEDDVGALGG